MIKSMNGVYPTLGLSFPFKGVSVTCLLSKFPGIDLSSTIISLRETQYRALTLLRPGLIALLLFGLSCSFQLLFGQILVDPSQDDPDYDTNKEMGMMQVAENDDASLNLNRPTVSKQANASQQMPGPCFVARDASFIAVPRNDDGSLNLNIPFSFELYGTSYNSLWINTNGNISFGGPLSAFSSTGFPTSTPMVAPFWADVDTRNTLGGQIYYKINPTNIIVTWEGVGYYNQMVDKRNTFQVIISTLADPLTGVGNNVTFGYGDMQWTTGSASGGTGGFGGTPATLGVNAGNNIDFVQVGRFNTAGTIYDGPSGSNNGVDFLDDGCFNFDVSSAGNVPPTALDFPAAPVTIACGETFMETYSFIAPENGQNVSAVVNANGACNTTSSTTSGSIATVTVTLHGDLCNLGTNTIDIAVTDDGVPPETSNFQLTIIVDNSGICPSACTAGVGDLVITEIMRDPTTVSDANGEWFEVYNPTGAPIDMQSIEIKDDGTDDHIIISSLIVPAGGYVVLGRNSDMAANGGISIDYAYGSDITLANGVDELILECLGTEIDRVEFTGFPTTAGASIKLDPSALNAADNDSASNWCVSTTDISGTNTNKGTPGIANPSCCGMDPSAPPPVVSLTSVPSSACEGTNVQISASVSGGQGAIGSANPESIIPRSNDTYADNLITLDGGGSVSATSKITVSLNIDHNRISDVDAYLVGPGDCGAYELFTDVGGGGDNMTNTVLASDAATLISSGSAPFSGTFRPEGDFTLPPSYANAATTGVTTSLLGCPVSGDWTLKLIDDQTGTNGGVLTDWSLAISPTGVAPSFTLSDGTNTIETNETGVFSVTPAIGTTDYTIDYRGPNGCMGQGMTSVDIFDVPAIDDITTTCANANDGTITVGATIDNANFAGTDIGIIEYSFDGGLSWETDNMESDLAPGVYQVGVRNSATTDCATNFTPVTLSGPIVANDLQVCTGAPSPLDAPFIVDEDCDPVFMAMTITTGTLDANDDTYAKSSNENSYLPGATVSYDVISIRPGQSGNYRIESCGFGFDGSLSIYTAPFDPDNPGTNFIRMDDDGYNGGSGCANGNDGAFGTNNPRVTLDVNQEYILVIQGENSGELGNWEIRFTGGPAAVFVGEPAQIEWYDGPMGGNLVGTGMTFDPTVATAENTNPVSTGTAGTTTFYAACSGAQGDCRVPAVFTVTQLPTVTITADPTGDICLGSTVQYNAEVTPNNSDYTYFWSAYNGPFNNNNGPNNGFNDRTLQNPTRAWTASAGDKSVGVVVSTPSCPDVEVGYDFNVNPLPTVDILPFQQNPFATLCSGETGVYLANISNAGGGIVNSYTWSVDPSAGVNITPQGQSGDVSGTRNIQIDFPLNTGTTDITYTVTLVLEDANGCVNTASQVVVVQPQPADPIPGTTAKEVCQDPDLTPNLTNTGINVTNTLAANEKVVWVLTGIPTGSSYSMGQEFTTDDCGDAFQNFGELAVANFSKVIRVNDSENAPEGTYTFETYIVNCDTDCESARVDGFSITVNPLPTLSCPTVAPQCPNGASIDLSLLDYSESPVGGIFAFSGAGVSGTNFDPETAGVGTHTITVTYTAPNGCDEECTIDVEVFADIDPPTFTCPADREVVLDANCQFEVPDLITGILVDDNCPAATIAQDPIATTLISSADEQTSVVTIIATDAAGNTNTTACEVTLTAQDMTPPEAICQDVTVSLDANGMAVVMASAVNNGSTDNCGIQSISLIDASLNADQNVTPEVIFGTGNINGAFTVNESGPIELALRAKQRFPAPDNVFNSNGDGSYTHSNTAGTFSFSCPDCAASWNFEWSVNTDPAGDSGEKLDEYTYEMGIDYDNTDGLNYLRFDPINGDGMTYFDHALGTNATGNGGGMSATPAGDASAYFAELSNNNVAQNSWNLDFFDGGPFTFSPTNDGRYDIYLAAYDASGTEVARTSIIVIVGAGTASSTGTQNQLVFFDCDDTGLNTDAVQLLVTDNAGNTGVCPASVTINDGILPTLDCPLADTIYLPESGDTTFSRPDFVAEIGVTADDNCPESLTNILIPNGSTNRAFDCNDLGMVRTVTFVVRDGNGNEANCMVDITTLDTIPPTFTCPADQEVMLDANCEFEVPDLVTSITVEDNCPGATIAQDPVATTLISSADEQTTVVTITATDAAGNTNTTACEVTLTAQDMTPPTFACPADQEVMLDANCQFEVPDLITGILVDDNCPDATIAQDPVATTLISSADEQTTVVTITATDAAGNTNATACEVTLTAQDMTPPTFNCPADQEVMLDANCQFEVPDLITGILVDDNCPDATIAQDPVATTLISSADEQTIVVTITATDAAGNTNTTACEVTLTAQDMTPPTFACPADRMVMTDDMCMFQAPNLVAEVIPMDNCAGPFTMIQEPAAGTTLRADSSGPVSVIIMVTDVAGNSTSCTVTLSIPPSCEFPFEITNSFDSTDPCSCNDDQGQNNQAGDGTFNETVTVSGEAGFLVRVSQATGLLNISLPAPLTASTPGNYTISFDHQDRAGYAITQVEFSIDGGATWNLALLDDGTTPVAISNTCAYPVLRLEPDLANTYCQTAASITLGAAFETSISNPDPIFDPAAMSTSFTIDGQPATAFDPSTLSGTVILQASYTPNNGAGMGGTTTNPAIAIDASNCSVILERMIDILKVDCGSFPWNGD